MKFPPKRLLLAVLIINCLYLSTAEVRCEPTLRVLIGTEHDYPPYSFLDVDGTPTGFNIELTRAVAKAAKLEIKIDYRPWNEIRHDLENGDINAISGMYYSQERDNRVDFSQPFAIIHHAIFSRSDSLPIKSADELAGKKLIVMQGDIMYDYAMSRGWSENIVVTKNQPEALKLLASGQHDYALMANLPGLYWLKKLQLTNIIANGPLFHPAKYCYAVQEGDSDLLFKFIEGLAQVKDTGEYYKIYDTWFGALEHNHSHYNALLRYGIIGLLVLSLFLLGGLFWNLSLKRQVAQRTEELKGEMTQHQLADEALRQSELELNAIYDNAPLIMLLVDRERRIVKMNALGLAMARSSEEEVLGHRGGDALRCIHSSDAPAGCGFAPACQSCGVRNTVLSTFATQKDINRAEASLCYDHPDGAIDMHMLISTKILDIKGEQLALVCLEDVTDRKRAEEDKIKLESQLRQSQKMEAIGTLAGGIAHDFNNILGAILGYSQMALEELPHNEQATKDISQVITSGLRARDLIQQILTFSRQTEQNFTPVAIQAIVTETIKLLRPSIPATIEIQQHLDPTCGPALADASQISQIIINLCTNSCHAMGSNNGTLTLEVESTFISADMGTELALPEGKYIRFEVRDTGHGMSHNVMDRIFEPFFTTKNVGEGSGLGLAVIHGIITSCHGSIKVDSIPDKGTVFQVYFPELENEEIYVHEDKKKPRGNEHILIVDDEIELANILKRMLTGLGYTAVSFYDSEQALETFKNNPDLYDLVITDLFMPKMTGDVLAREILTIKPDLPILFCTGFSNAIHTEEYSDSSSNYILKPVIKGNLARSIRTILDKG